jgi:hypothetical protein
LKLLTIVSRKQVIKFYLDGEALKKNTPIPPTFSALNLDDPSATDQWLRENDFKSGVITGFAQWAFVELSVDDIGNIAVVNHIFKSSRVLKNLAGTRELENWIPNRNPLPPWFGPLWANEWRDEYSIILRPTTPGERAEGATLYAEDGSGRSICYYRGLLRTGATSRMRGYIGFDPSPRSAFFTCSLEGEFATNAARYSTLENMFKAINARLVD